MNTKSKKTPDNQQNVLARIRNLQQITRSEEKVARFLERHYPLAAFESIISISEKAGVSKATVGRFINRLGYQRFSDFMKSMQQDMLSRLESPIDRYAKKREVHRQQDDRQLTVHVSHAINNLQETLERIDLTAFSAAAELMSTSSGRLFVAGSATSQALADYFRLLASYLRPNVSLVDTNLGMLAHTLADISSHDVLFALAHQRFSRITIQVAQWFSKHNAPVILLTDRAINPISRYASIKLVSYSNAPLMFSSRCASFMLLEALIAAMTVKLDPQVQQRFASFDQFFEDFSVFASNQSVTGEKS